MTALSMKQKDDKTILLVGGGTGGPMAPLLALAETIRELRPHIEFLVVGTKQGVEGRMAKVASLPFVSVRAAKLNRFWSFKNLFSPFIFLVSLIESYKLLKKIRPLCVIGAGGFVQVPVMYVAWVIGIPVFIHQQDIVAGLANKLCAPIAKRISVTFKKSLADFPQSLHLAVSKPGTGRVVLTGNPCRKFKKVSKQKAMTHFGLDEKYPTLLVLGGGGGALAINELVSGSAHELTRYMNVLHITGKGKGTGKHQIHRYKTVEFLDEMELAYAVADVVVSRAGLGTLTELASLSLPAVLVPIPGSHQEQNALYLREAYSVVMLDQRQLNSQNLVLFLRNLLFEQHLLTGLGRALHQMFPDDANQAVAKVVLGALES